VVSTCMAVLSVVTVGWCVVVDKCMSDNISNPVSDMSSHGVVGVSSNACISADTGTVSTAIGYEIQHTVLKSHSMPGTPPGQYDTVTESSNQQPPDFQKPSG